MRAEKVVAYLLDVDAGVRAIVGDKVYAVLAPQADLAPFVVYAKESANRQAVISMGGPIVVEAIINIQCVANDYATLKDLGEAVRLALLEKRGNVAGVDLMATAVGSEGGDVYEPDLRLFGQNWLYNITHQE